MTWELVNFGFEVFKDVTPYTSEGAIHRSYYIVDVAVCAAFLLVVACALRDFGAKPRDLGLSLRGVYNKVFCVVIVLCGVLTLHIATGYYQYPATLLLTTIYAPVIEELLCRGVIFAGLAKRWPIGIAAIASSALFAIGPGHVEEGWSFVMFTLLMGLALCWVYTRTKSLWCCIAFHACWNTNALSLIVTDYSKSLLT